MLRVRRPTRVPVRAPVRGPVYGAADLPLDAANIAPADVLVACSTRRLTRRYRGILATVRRSSDSAEAFVGYDDAGALDLADLLTHTGTGGSDDGAVVTLINQAATGLDNARQATAADQPLIVDDGAAVSGGIDFDGAGDALAIAYNAAMNVSALTAIARITTTHAAGGLISIVSHANATGDDRSWALVVDNGDISGLVHDAGTPADRKRYVGSAVNDGASRVVAMTFDGTDLALYVDGAAETGVTKTDDDPIADLHPSTTDMLVGGWMVTTPALLFDGTVDDVIVLNRALSAAEIATLSTELAA